MAWATRQKLPCTQKMVLLMLADRHNNDTGQCNPSHEMLAEDCGLSRRSVVDQIDRLAVAGLLRIRHRATGNVKLPNQYTLVLSAGVQAVVKEFKDDADLGQKEVPQPAKGVVQQVHVV